MHTHVRRFVPHSATLLLALLPVLAAAGELTITAQSGGLQTFAGWGIHPTFTKFKDKFRDTLNALVVKGLNLNMVRFYVGGTDPDSIMRDFDASYKYPSGGNTIDDFKDQNPDMMFLLGEQEQINTAEKIGPFCAKWAEAVKRLRDEKGFDIQWCTVTNEPNDKGKVWKGQDSTQRIIPEELYPEVVKQMRAAFDAKGLEAVKLYVPETSNVDDVCLAFIDLLRNDTDAWDAVGGLFTKSYNMCANWDMKELAEETHLPYFAAAGANMLDWWQYQAMGVTPEDVGVEQKPDDDHWAAEMAGRILSDFNHMVTHWLTYLPAGEVDRNRRFAAHNLMEYFNSLDTLLQRKYDPKDFQVLGNNEAYLMITLKYWYLKHLTQMFDVGCTFRYCACDPPTPYEDMVMTFGQKPAVCATAACNPDKSWTIAVVNITGCRSDDLAINPVYHPTQYFKYYPAETYDVTVKVEELAGSGTQKLALTRSSKTQHGAFEDSVEMVDGECTVTVGPKQLITLRGAKGASSGTNVSDGDRRAHGVTVVQGPRRNALGVRIRRPGAYRLEVVGLDGRTIVKRDAGLVSQPCTLNLGLGRVGGGAYLLRIVRNGSPYSVCRIAAQ